LNDECGYPTTERITLDLYEDQYNRNPIAKKVVELLPRHCWREQPSVFEDENPDVETPFEAAVRELGDKLRGDNWYEGDQGNPLWEILARSDIVSGIGHYGVTLFGVGGDEGKDLSKPLEFRNKKDTVQNAETLRELIYLRTFPESLAQILEFDDDITSPRYGMPTYYNLDFDDTSRLQISADTTIRPRSESIRVHWSRVIHITDDLTSSEIFHIPRMRPVLNRLLDLDKTYGGSAEMFWQGALPGLSFETHPQLGGDVEIDSSSMKTQIEYYMNGLQRFLVTSGMAAKSLAPAVADPTAHINTQIEAICIALDCPKRIFMGSERGELSSAQDSGEWTKVIEGRRNGRVTPRLIIPTFNRMISLGFLPVPQGGGTSLQEGSPVEAGMEGAKPQPIPEKPTGPKAKKPKGYGVSWPTADGLDKVQQAAVALQLTQAIVAYIAGDGIQVIPIMNYLTMILGFTQDEATSIKKVLDEEGLLEARLETKIEGEEKALEEPPPMPIKMKEGEKLVQPPAGKKPPFPPKEE